MFWTWKQVSEIGNGNGGDLGMSYESAFYFPNFYIVF